MSIVAITGKNLDEYLEKNEIVVLDFWAEWCMPCHDFNRIIEQVSKKNPEILFGQVNVEQEKELATEFQVRSIPFLVILKQKVAVLIESGILPEEAIQDLLNQAKNLEIQEVLKDLG